MQGHLDRLTTFLSALFILIHWPYLSSSTCRNISVLISINVELYTNKCFAKCWNIKCTIKMWKIFIIVKFVILNNIFTIYSIFKISRYNLCCVFLYASVFFLQVRTVLKRQNGYYTEMSMKCPEMKYCLYQSIIYHFNEKNLNLQCKIRLLLIQENKLRNFEIKWINNIFILKNIINLKVMVGSHCVPLANSSHSSMFWYPLCSYKR